MTLKVPEGFYVAHYATGSTWYGTEKAFGPIGSYTATNEFSVAKKKWVLTAGAEQEGISCTRFPRRTCPPRRTGPCTWRAC